ALGDQLGPEEGRRLEWAGIRSVNQLRALQKETGAEVIGRVSQLPIDRLRAALAAAAQPHVSQVVAETPDGGGTPRLRIHGYNLRDGAEPAVRIGGQPAAVLHSTETELLVQPEGDARSGTVDVRGAPDLGTAAAL